MQYRFFEDNGESAYDVLRKSIDCQASQWFTLQLHTFFSKKKKQPLAYRKIQEPSERERFLLEDATRELQRVATDERASLFSALQSVRTRPRPGRGCAVSNPDPNNTIGLLGIPFMEFSKNPGVLGSFCKKTAEMCCSKYTSNWDVAIVTKGRRRWLKKLSFKLSESFKSAAQGVLEIFDESVPGGGGGGTMYPNPLIGIGLKPGAKDLMHLYCRTR